MFMMEGLKMMTWIFLALEWHPMLPCAATTSDPTQAPTLGISEAMTLPPNAPTTSAVMATTTTSNPTTIVTTTASPLSPESESIVTLSLDTADPLHPQSLATALVQTYSKLFNASSRSRKRRDLAVSLVVDAEQTIIYRVVVTAISFMDVDFHVIEDDTAANSTLMPSAAFVANLLRQNAALLQDSLENNGIRNTTVILAAKGFCVGKSEFLALDMKLLNVNSEAEALKIVKSNNFVLQLANGLSLVESISTIPTTCTSPSIACAYAICGISLDSSCDVTITFVPVDTNDPPESIPIGVGDCDLMDVNDLQVYAFALQVYIRRPTYFFPEVFSTTPALFTGGTAPSSSTMTTPSAPGNETSSPRTNTLSETMTITSFAATDITSPLANSTFTANATSLAAETSTSGSNTNIAPFTTDLVVNTTAENNTSTLIISGTTPNSMTIVSNVTVTSFEVTTPLISSSAIQSTIASVVTPQNGTTDPGLTGPPSSVGDTTPSTTDASANPIAGTEIPRTLSATGTSADVTTAVAMSGSPTLESTPSLFLTTTSADINGTVTSVTGNLVKESSTSSSKLFETTNAINDTTDSGNSTLPFTAGNPVEPITGLPTGTSGFVENISIHLTNPIVSETAASITDGTTMLVRTAASLVPVTVTTVTCTEFCPPVFVPVEIIPTWMLVVIIILAVLCLVLLIIIIFILFRFFCKPKRKYTVHKVKGRDSVGIPVVPITYRVPKPLENDDVINGKNRKGIPESVEMNVFPEGTEIVDEETQKTSSPPPSVNSVRPSSVVTLPPIQPPARFMSPGTRPFIEAQESIDEVLSPGPPRKPDAGLLHVSSNPSDPSPSHFPGHGSHQGGRNDDTRSKIQALLNDAYSWAKPNAVNSMFGAMPNPVGPPMGAKEPAGISMPATHGRNSAPYSSRFSSPTRESGP